MPRGIAKNHDAKRVALRKGAAVYFAAHGYDRASMTGAARSCGVSKALIYHYYDSKEALLFDILRTHLAELNDAVSIAQPDGLPALIHALLIAYSDADAEHKLQLEALRSLPENLQAPLFDLQRGLVETMSSSIAKIRMLDPDRQRALTMSVFGVLNWFYMWHRPDKGLSRAEYSELATDFIMGGIVAV